MISTTTLYSLLVSQGAKPCKEDWNKVLALWPEQIPLNEQSVQLAVEANIDLAWLVWVFPPEILVDYQAKTQPFWDDYKAKRQPFWDDYKAKRQPFWDDYQAKRQLIWNEYWAKIEPIETEHQAKIEPIEAEYQAKRQPIWDDYQAKMKPIDADYKAKQGLLILECLKQMLGL